MSGAGTRPSVALDAARHSWAAAALVLLIRAYQITIAPLLGPRCRFAPSCSHYALEAVRVHGALRGAQLALLRLARCHPLCAGGIDPVPPPRLRRAPERATGK